MPTPITLYHPIIQSSNHPIIQSSNHPHAITLFEQIERIFLEALDCGERYTAHVVEAVCA